MASRHKAIDNHGTDRHDISYYHDIMHATQLGLHQLEKKITELTRHQERKKALSKASEDDAFKINMNHFRLKQCVNNTLKSNPEYYDFQSIFYHRLNTKKKYHYQEALIKKIPVIH